MKLGHGNEIKFLANLDTITYFMVVLDGEDTMRIACDSTDPERVIHISSVNGAVSLPTKGRFEIGTKFLEDPEGLPLGVQSRVDSKSVYKYAIPRLHSLLARLLRAATA